MRRICGLGLAALCLLVRVSPASADDPNPRRVGYVSNVSALEPNVLGVSVTADESNSLRLSNYSGKEIVVRGDRGEPLLRFEGSSVFENRASPTLYANTTRAVPPFAAAEAEPQWREVAKGLSYVWRDHRVVWTKPDPPRVVSDDPAKAHLIFRWEIPAAAAGKPFRIKGLLGWGPQPSTSNGTDWITVAAAAGGAVLLAAGAAVLGARRLRRRAPSST